MMILPALLGNPEELGLGEIIKKLPHHNFLNSFKI
jgi:hypothetical protein